MAEIVGRDAELATVRAFLDDGGGALVLVGEPGIGKTTLWLDGVAHAGAAGARVLSARPAEAEHGLAYAGLGDLFEDALEGILPGLAPPRRRALEGALLLDDTFVDPRALGLAVRDALHLLVDDGSVLVAIDDVHWLDAASSSALVFALRRLGPSRVRVLLARRLDESDLEHAVAASVVPIGELSAGALHRFLRERIDRSFARQTLLRIHEQSGGNPFFALEIARALVGEPDPTHPLPVPQTLVELVQARLSGLPRDTLDALALAAAVGTPTEAVLERAGVAATALAPAVDAGVVVRDGGTVRFTHPLLASALYDPGAHARLAEVVDDPLARARHLALSAETSDTTVARVLDDAAQAASGRGAVALAAELAEHALRLTPADEPGQRHRRALATARAHQAAGEWTRAQSIARDLLAEAEPGPQRAELLVFLADFEAEDQSAQLLEDALVDAASDPVLQTEIRIRIAAAVRFTKGFGAALHDARAALRLADELDNDALRISALNLAAFVGAAAGDPDAAAYAERAHELALALGNVDLLGETTAVVAKVLRDQGRYAEAYEMLERRYADAREHDERVAAHALWDLAWVELWRGNFEHAADCAARAYETVHQYGIEKHFDSLPGAWVAAFRGRFELARELAGRGLALCAQQIGVAGPLFPGVLGLVSFWSGDVEAGVEQLAEADRVAAAIDWREPCRRPWTAEYVEALLELGRIEEAVRVLGIWEADATALGRPYVLAQVTRCRGLVAAAEGRVDDAIALLEQAAEKHGAVGDRFGRARAFLALGVVRRRSRQKRAARDAIDAALAGFEELGAASWVEQARNELGSIGGRRSEDGLTAAERRVAVVAAEGRTNREIAAALSLSERTVAGHLTRIYAKLGVRSRTELVRKVETF